MHRFFFNTRKKQAAACSFYGKTTQAFTSTFSISAIYMV